MKIVIVGGVAGGATAAARIRRLDEQAEIVVFERSGFVSYAQLRTALLHRRRHPRSEKSDAPDTGSFFSKIFR